jgi:hypothetical protein
MYAASRKPDEESLDETSGSAYQEENDEDFDDDTVGNQVEYIGHEDDEEDEVANFSSGRPSERVTASRLIDSEDVPSLDICGMADAAHGEEKRSNIQKGYEPLRTVVSPPPPPPPPPPGQPKKKNKKSKSTKSKSVPLIAPPPEEKIKNWEESKMRAQNYVRAMKESLEKSDTKALDSSLDFFSLVPEEVSNIAPERITECDPSAVSDVAETDVVKTNTLLSALSEDSAQSQKDMEERGGNVSANQSAINRSLQQDEGGKADENDAYVDVILLESLHEPDEQIEDNDTDSADELHNDYAEQIVQQNDQQPSLFSSLSETKSKIFNNKSGNQLPDSALACPKMVDNKVAIDISDTLSVEEAKRSEERVTDVPKSTGSSEISQIHLDDAEVFSWFSVAVLKQEMILLDKDRDISEAARALLEDRDNFNSLCQYVAENVNNLTMLIRPDVEGVESVLSSFDESTVVSAGTATVASFDDSKLEQRRPLLTAVVLPDASLEVSPVVLAANCVSFFTLASKLCKVPSPFGDSNPFLTMIVESSLTKKNEIEVKTPQELLFDELDDQAELLVDFVYQVKCSCDADMRAMSEEHCQKENDHSARASRSMPLVEQDKSQTRRLVVPDGHPSPFESSVSTEPRIVAVVLSFLGDPVAVSRMKMLNRFCYRIVSENEHILMQNAVRTGGIEMSVRPAFWMWVTLQKCDTESHESNFNGFSEVQKKANEGKEGKWHHVIKRDVERSFGNMPPHKTGAKLRNDSIVRALVTWGQNRTMKRGVKGGGEPFPTPDIGPKSSRKIKARPQSPTMTSPPWEANRNGDYEEISAGQSGASETPTDTVSDWGGVSPKGSFAGSVNDTEYETAQEKQLSLSGTDMSGEELALALSGNSLTAEAKIDLRNKLSFILHAMAATHEDIGYCQGMDYVVAHLLRILQETIKWKAANHTLPSVISTASLIESSHPVRAEDYRSIYEEVDKCLVVEESILRVMDTFLISYNLKHMYWPELRCLKTCCRVFERLIQIKLPVLADHFEHHDLNVGLFALGWFQTLFLYLPSMPSATVCHMWDIWLVERSFKIFFRVGTAILFLSQPTLLNHELEGMMTYLNTIPDATLLRPDILIPCALNIKVTNRMLQELEAEVMQHP